MRRLSASWKTGADRLLLGLVSALVCCGAYISQARQFASSAPGEKTTIADDVTAHYHVLRGLRFNDYSCDYSY